MSCIYSSDLFVHMVPWLVYVGAWTVYNIITFIICIMWPGEILSCVNMLLLG